MAAWWIHGPGPVESPLPKDNQINTKEISLSSRLPEGLISVVASPIMWLPLRTRAVLAIRAYAEIPAGFKPMSELFRD